MYHSSTQGAAHVFTDPFRGEGFIYDECMSIIMSNLRIKMRNYHVIARAKGEGKRKCTIDYHDV